MNAPLSNIHFHARKFVPWMLLLFAILFAFNFYTNIHASSGIPFWDDDWDYFFGDSLGLRVPLTWNSLFAKENDFIAPMAWVFGHVVGQLFGANLLVFRLLTWLLFASVLAIYLKLLLRIAPELGWIAVAVSFILLSTVNAESFYFQHLALFQPLFFLIFFGFLFFSLKENLTAEVILFFIAATFGILGTAYVFGTIGYALALAVVGASRRGIDAFRNTRLLALMVVGLGVTAAIGYLTLAGSYVNHTGQDLVLPWNRDFWFFIFSAFSSALGFTSDLQSRYFLAVGLAAFALYAVPMIARLFRATDESSSADLVLGSLLAGTIALTMMTAIGRSHFCGLALADIKSCGSSPRYVFPIILALPAAIVALARSLPGTSSVRPIAVGVVLSVLAGGYLFDRSLRPSLARWDFSAMQHMMTERDEAARTCLAEYLEASDWKSPLICPTISRGINVAPFLRTASETGASFLKPIIAARGSANDRPSFKSLLSSEVRSAADDIQLEGLQPGPKSLTGNIDRVYDLKDGSQAAIGWAADLGAHEPISHVVAVIDGRVAAVGFSGIGRPDIAAAFNDSKLTNSGFAIPLGTKLAPGKSVRLFAVTRSSQFAEITGDDLNPIDESVLPARGDTGALPNAQCHLDDVQVVGTSGLPTSDGKALFVRGWAVVSGREAIVPDSVIVSLHPPSGQNVLARTHKQPRPDVNGNFGQPTMADTGFATTVSLKGMSGTYQLNVLYVYDGRTYSCGIQQPVGVR